MKTPVYGLACNCYVEFRDRYSPSFSICFRPFSFILHPFLSILCYSPVLFYPLPSSVTFRYSVTLGHSVTFRHIPSFPLHSIFRPFFRLFCLILSSFHIGIRLYRVLTSTFTLAPFLFQPLPLSFRLCRVPAFYCIPTFIVL